MSKRQAVAMLAPKLYEMRRKGYAWRDVAAWLSGHGLTMSAAALQRHLRAVKDASVRGSVARARQGSRRRQTGRLAGACRVQPRGGRPDGPAAEGFAALGPPVVEPKARDLEPPKGASGFTVRPDRKII